MPSFRRLQFALPVLIAGALIAARPAPRPIASGCAPRNAHTGAFIANASKTVSTMVKLQLQSLGWNSAPTAFVVETSAPACDAVVAAHNAYAGSTDADYKVTSPVIVRADHSWLVEVPPTAKRVETITFVYDSALKFKTIF